MSAKSSGLSISIDAPHIAHSISVLQNGIKTGHFPSITVLKLHDSHSLTLQFILSSLFNPLSLDLFLELMDFSD